LGFESSHFDFYWVNQTSFTAKESPTVNLRKPPPEGPFLT
jgi:hypothetical protein